MRIILASASPRREELLKKVINKFEVIPSNIEEEKIQSENADELVEKLSSAKAENVFIQEQDKEDDLIVIGVDTVVEADNSIIGKPKSEAEAKEILSNLSGKDNDVYTGLTIIVKQKNKITKEVTNSKTTVSMKSIDSKEIDDYIATGEPMDKAGAYAIQGEGAKFIEKIDGDYNSVVGLNIDQLKEILKKYIEI